MSGRCLGASSGVGRLFWLVPHQTATLAPYADGVGEAWDTEVGELAEELVETTVPPGRGVSPAGMTVTSARLVVRPSSRAHEPDANAARVAISSTREDTQVPRREQGACPPARRGGREPTETSTRSTRSQKASWPNSQGAGWPFQVPSLTIGWRSSISSRRTTRSSPTSSAQAPRTGEWGGIAPTGRSFEGVDEIYILRVTEGKLSTAVGVVDNLSRLRQLGIRGEDV